MIDIVPALEQHLPTMCHIENECISPPWSEGALLNELGRADGLAAVAVDSGTVAGFVLLRRAADEAELYQIAVAEPYRRRGIGDALIKEAVSYCRQNDVLSIYLEVRKSNRPAIELYKKHGFKSEGRRKNYYSSPVEDAVVMALELTAEKNTV